MVVYYDSLMKLIQISYLPGGFQVNYSEPQLPNMLKRLKNLIILFEGEKSSQALKN